MAVQVPFKRWEVRIPIAHEREGRLGVFSLELEAGGVRVHQPLPAALLCGEVKLALIGCVERLAQHVVNDALLSLLLDDLYLFLCKTLVVEVFSSVFLEDSSTLSAFALVQSDPLLVFKHRSLPLGEIAVLHRLERRLHPGLVVVAQVWLQEDLVSVGPLVDFFRVFVGVLCT